MTRNICLFRRQAFTPRMRAFRRFFVGPDSLLASVQHHCPEQADTNGLSVKKRWRVPISKVEIITYANCTLGDMTEGHYHPVHRLCMPLPLRDSSVENADKTGLT
jgi:hypothetical protein